GLLALGLVYGIQPWVAVLTARIPDFLFLPAWILWAADLADTLYLLRSTRSTDALRWRLNSP
ncbi:MAG: hypothetical protein RR216_05220, partial [Pseudoflavonifractor sp.]